MTSPGLNYMKYDPLENSVSITFSRVMIIFLVGTEFMNRGTPPVPTGDLYAKDDGLGRFNFHIGFPKILCDRNIHIW